MVSKMPNDYQKVNACKCNEIFLSVSKRARLAEESRRRGRVVDFRPPLGDQTSELPVEESVVAKAEESTTVEVHSQNNDDHILR